MKIQNLATPGSQPVRRSTSPQSAKAATNDRFEPGAAREALAKLPPLARSTTLGVATISPPLLGGLTAGAPGALVGGLVSAGANYAVTGDLPGSAVRSLVPTVLGAAIGLSSQMSPFAAVGLSVALGAGAGLLAGLERAQESGRSQDCVIPINQPGQAVTLSDHLVPGKTNVVIFSADWCPACQRVKPEVERYTREHPEQVLLEVDIQDWDSEVSRQYRLESIPHFKIFDGEGQMTAEGKAAREVINAQLAEGQPPADQA